MVHLSMLLVGRCLAVVFVESLEVGIAEGVLEFCLVSAASGSCFWHIERI